MFQMILRHIEECIDYQLNKIDCVLELIYIEKNWQISFDEYSKIS